MGVLEDGARRVRRRRSHVRRVLGVELLAGRRPLARAARARAGERDQAGQDGAKQRQKDDRLIHPPLQPFMILMSSTAMEPLLR